MNKKGPMERIFTLIEKDLKKLDLAIDTLSETKVKVITNIIEHIIKSGGKRIRPILVILTSKLCGYKGKRHIIYGAVIEFIHTATLLHDDVIDNAELRRGSSTANILWGNQASVLVGDFLYSKSFELMSKEGNMDIIKTVSNATTILSEGEILELIKTSDTNLTEEEYFEIINKKTAILFSTACEIGGILGKATRNNIRQLRDYGKYLGIAFQLVDDLLDYVGEKDTFGKQVGTDLKEGKVTLPLIYTLKHGSEKDASLIKEILLKREITSEDFKTVKDIVEKYGGFQYTYDITKTYIDKARKCLEEFRPSQYKDALLSLTNMMLTRKV